MDKQHYEFCMEPKAKGNIIHVLVKLVWEKEKLDIYT